jgi:hypothetical protein
MPFSSESVNAAPVEQLAPLTIAGTESCKVVQGAVPYVGGFPSDCNLSVGAHSASKGFVDKKTRRYSEGRPSSNFHLLVASLIFCGFLKCAKRSEVYHSLRFS